MSSDERRAMIQKALAAAVDGSKVSTLAAAAGELEMNSGGLQIDKYASQMMHPFPRSRYPSCP